MSGIGGQSAKSKVVTIQAELPPTVDGILERVRQILLLGEVQSLSMRVGEPISYQRLIRTDEEIDPSESTQGFAELSLMDVVRNSPMEDFRHQNGESVAGLSPNEEIVRMWINMEMRGWYVTHVMTSPCQSTNLWPWLGLLQAPDVFLGARVVESGDLNDDVFLLCGAKTRLAAITEIGLVLKGNADAPKSSK